MVSKKGKEAAGKGKDVIGKDTGKGKSEKVAGKGKEVVGKVTRKGQKVTGKGKEVPGKSKRVIGKSKTVAGKDTEKGKEVPGKVTGKRKCAADTDEAGGRKKRNRGVVQFFEDEVYNGVDDDDDDLSDYGGHWDFFEDVFEAQSSGVKNDSGKPRSVPFFFEEEELSDGEMEEMVEECYRVGSNFITYANDTANTGISVDGNENLSPFKEPIVWKVKCKIGSEKQSVFCLMQKYVEFNSLGNKLQIISAFSPDHVKGFIYIEAEKQADIYEACKGICTIFSNQVAHIPKDDVSRTFSIQSKRNEVSIGLFGRVKNGRYKGDLAQIIFVNDFRKKATVKLIPRIDLQVLAEKYGGGVRSKKSGVPPPRFITSTELEEFRPLIQCRRDHECGLAFEILDGMMFKDGYLYKKVSIDSLNLYGVTPSEDELFKFESFKNEISDCEEWLTDLYDEKNKEPSFINCEKGNDGKGEGSSSSSIETNFEVGDFVLFNWADFGVIVGSEKDENYMILKESPEGPMVVMIDVPQLKKALFGNRFTALDNREKIIFINDTVRVLEGPLEGRQGNVKHIYRGIVFLHDEVEQENNGYFCCKSLSCEKINFSDDASKGKVSDAVFSTFNDPPLSPLARTKGRDNRFNKENKEGINVGQSLRIRVGPLKGYLCRILAIHRTDITVKLDSQQKTLSVKYEHLAGAHGRSSAIPLSDDKDAKPIYPLGKPEGSVECMSGARTSAAVGKRSSWPAFPSSGTQPKSNSPMETDNKGGSCVTKLASKPSSTWGIPPVGKKPAFINEQAGDNWGKGGNNWSNKPNLPGTYQGNPNTSKSNTAPSPWGKSNTEKKDSARAWGRKTVKSPGGGQCGSWGKNNPEIFYSGPAWGKSKTVEGRAGKDAEDDIMGKCSKPWGNKKEFIGKKVGWKSYGQGEDSQGGGWDRTKCFNGVGGGVRNWGRGGLRGRGGGGRERGGRVGGGRLGRGGRGDGNRGSFQGRGRSGRGGIGFGGRGGGNGDWGNNQNGGGGGFGGRGGNGDWGTNKNGGGGGGRGRGSGGGFGGRGGGRRGGNGDWGTNKNGGDGVGRGDGGGGSVRGGCDGGFGGRDKNSDRENNQNGGGGSASRGGGGGRSGSGGGDSGGHGRADAGGWSKENNDGGSKGGW